MITTTERQKASVYLLFNRSKRSLFMVALCSFALLLASCGDNSTGTNGGGTNGGNNGGNNGGSDIPTDPTFSNVQQIFEASCGGGSCHIETSTNGVRLNSYSNVINSQGAQYGELVVQPGDADGSPLVDKIEPNPQFGTRMPQTGDFLSDERIDQIRTWINEGAQDN